MLPHPSSAAILFVPQRLVRATSQRVALTYLILVLLRVSAVKAFSQPTITSQPADKAAVWGDRITFGVGFTAAGPTSVSWHFDGATLAGRTNNSLVLTNVTFANTGSYFAIVTDSSGS